MKKRQANMLRGPLLPGIIAYTVPIILTSVLQLLFNAADLVVVGQFRGSVSLAAVGATGSLTNLIVNLFIGLSVGAGVVVAHGLGAREEGVVHRTVHTAIPLALISGAVLTVIGVIFAGTFLKWMGTPADVLPKSKLYMQIYFGGMTFTMLYNFCASILRAAGDTKSPLYFLFAAGVLNVMLNVLFVVVFHADVEGVALATTISQAVSAVLVLLALMRRTDACRFSIRQIRISRRELGRMVAIGLPAGIQGSLFSISNVIIQSSVNSFDKVVMSGNAAAGNIEGFVYTAMNAFQQTTVNFVGQNVGAQQYDRVKKTVLYCLGCVTVLGISISLAVYGLRDQLLSIYIVDSLEAIEYGILRMTWIVLPYFLCGIMDVATGALRGMGASTVPMIICVLGVCVFRIGWVATVFQIPAYHTPGSLYFSYPVSWLLTLAAELTAFVMLFRRRVKALKV